MSITKDPANKQNPASNVQKQKPEQGRADLHAAKPASTALHGKTEQPNKSAQHQQQSNQKQNPQNKDKANPWK